jgi:hypothetical protein
VKYLFGFGGVVLGVRVNSPKRWGSKMQTFQYNWFGTSDIDGMVRTMIDFCTPIEQPTPGLPHTDTHDYSDQSRGRDAWGGAIGVEVAELIISDRSLL